MSLIADHEPDELGRFTAEGVAYLASRRGCVLVGVEKLAAVIRKQDAPEAEPEFARWADEGRWRPAEVYAACTRARGEKIPPSAPPKGYDQTTTGMNEELIAELIACDGVRPYYGGGWSIALEVLLRTAVYRNRGIEFGDRKAVKKAVLAVSDAGLAELRLGPRKGFATATLTWNARARLPTAEERAEERASRRDADEFLR